MGLSSAEAKQGISRAVAAGAFIGLFSLVVATPLETLPGVCMESTTGTKTPDIVLRTSVCRAFKRPSGCPILDVERLERAGRVRTLWLLPHPTRTSSAALASILAPARLVEPQPSIEVPFRPGASRIDPRVRATPALCATLRPLWVDRAPYQRWTNAVMWSAHVVLSKSDGPVRGDGSGPGADTPEPADPTKPKPNYLEVLLLRFPMLDELLVQREALFPKTTFVASYHLKGVGVYYLNKTDYTEVFLGLPEPIRTRVRAAIQEPRELYQPPPIRKRTAPAPKDEAKSPPKPAPTASARTATGAVRGGAGESPKTRREHLLDLLIGRD